MQGLKENNQGYTLVELLVALAALAIVIVPFLHGFVVSARVNANAKNVLRATTAGTNVMELIKSESVEDLLKQSTYDAAEKRYTFTFADQKVDGTAFCVEGTLDPDCYADSYNDAQSILSDMNSENNAFVIETESMDESGADALGLSASQYDKITRTITIDIAESDSAVSVCATISYTDGTNMTYAMDCQCVFSAAGSSRTLENVFLIYQAGLGSENIVINNTDNYPVNVYLVKQDDADAASGSRYRAVVSVNESARSSSEYKNDDGSYAILTRIRTNVDKDQLTLYFNNMTTLSVGSESVAARDLVGLTDLVSGEAGERLYQVSLKVYEQETHELLYEMEGTKEK